VVPKPSPEREAEKQRLDLSGVLDMAAASYQRRLFLPRGRRRALLTGRASPRTRYATTVSVGPAKAVAPSRDLGRET